MWLLIHTITATAKTPLNFYQHTSQNFSTLFHLWFPSEGKLILLWFEHSGFTIDFWKQGSFQTHNLKIINMNGERKMIPSFYFWVSFDWFGHHLHTLCAPTETLHHSSLALRLLQIRTYDKTTIMSCYVQCFIAITSLKFGLQVKSNLHQILITMENSWWDRCLKFYPSRNHHTSVVCINPLYLNHYHDVLWVSVYLKSLFNKLCRLTPKRTSRLCCTGPVIVWIPLTKGQ